MLLPVGLDLLTCIPLGYQDSSRKSPPPSLTMWWGNRSTLTLGEQETGHISPSMGKSTQTPTEDLPCMFLRPTSVRGN
jgi:hypothetical protein